MRGMVILFLTLTITFALEFCHLGIKMRKKNENHLILLISPMANYPCECDGKSKTLELITKYLIQRVSLQLKKWMNRSTGVGRGAQRLFSVKYLFGKANVA